MQSLKQLSVILTSQDKTRFAWLFLAILVMGLFEVVGVASIVPFMQIVAQPDSIQENGWLKWAYERSGFETDQSFLFAIGVCTLGLMAVANMVSAFTKWLQYKLAWSSAHNLEKRLLNTYVHQPYQFFLSRNSAELGKQILIEVNQFVNSVIIPMTEFVARSFVVLVLLTLLVVVDPRLALIVAITLGSTYGLIYFGIRAYLVRIGRERFEAVRIRYKTAGEALQGIKHIKIQGQERYFVNRFAVASKRFTRVEPQRQVISRTPRYFVETLAFGGVLAIVLYMLAREQDFQAVIPLLSLYVVAGYRLLPALQQLFLAASTVKYNVPVIESLYDDLIHTEAEKSEWLNRRKNGGEEIVFKQELRVSNLTFAYQNTDDIVLDGIDLVVSHGTSVAFVGPTGSGKTTLVDIIIGLLPPLQGSVLVDGIPIGPNNVRAWQAIVGYVPQEVTLYDDTITRNIVFGQPEDDISIERVKEAAKLASLHEFIEMELEEGYETVVGERGVRLSGGQRQRIGLARAFYRHPKVLILDEATSSLDGVTEEAVMQAITQLPYDITIIMIAHRLATVRKCDHIYLLERGCVVAEGQYDTLIQESSLFRGMAKLAS